VIVSVLAALAIAIIVPQAATKRVEARQQAVTPCKSARPMKSFRQRRRLFNERDGSGQLSTEQWER
jgi:hypothetical protein